VGAAPLPDNEGERLKRLHLYKVLDTPPEASFDCITRLAASILGTPIAAISLIDDRRQWFKSAVGLGTTTETTRDVAFCAHAILGTDVFVVPDARKNPTFSQNPLVTGELGIRFYAGAPLATRDGLNLGSVCVIDQKPRDPTPEQIALLQDLSVLVVDELELRLAGRAALEEVHQQRRLDQMKTAFVSDVSHELRTPLTSIIGSLGLLLSGTMGEIPDQGQRVLEIAERNSQLLLQLINDLLDMAKLEAGEVKYDFRPLDLKKAIDEALENLGSYGEGRGITFALKSDGPAVVEADARRITQVVNNLVSNAVKFSPDGSEVIVTLSTRAGCAEVSVIDRGPGIPEAIRPRIFQKFVQGKAGKQKTAGSGLGLSIAKVIVEGHAGNIGFETGGDGTRMYFDLPLV
jgi:signal transduction histidine kinase